MVASITDDCTGKTREDLAIVTKLRFDDQTGEDMYDIVQKANKAVVFKWIPRMELKRPALEGDALMLKQFAVFNL